MEVFTEDEIRYFKQLDEQQQRLFAGLRAKILGRAGVGFVSAALGLHKNTVRRGKVELDDLPVSPEKRIRKAGGGTKNKELLGNFYRKGSTYCAEGQKVNDHDFATFAEGRLVSHGIYDVGLHHLGNEQGRL